MDSSEKKEASEKIESKPTVPDAKQVKDANCWAPIKQQYLDLNHEKKVVEKYLPKDAIEHIKQLAWKEKKPENEEETDDVKEPPKKKQKLKGRNKQRPRDKAVSAADRLCPSIMNEKECLYKDNCKFSHDVEAFLAGKPSDLGENCYTFDTYGKCHFGIICRFGSKHMDSSHKNMVNEEKVKHWQDKKVIINRLDKDIQKKLWKRKYDFSKANNIIREINKKAAAEKKAKNSNTSSTADTLSSDVQPKKQLETASDVSMDVTATDTEQSVVQDSAQTASPLHCDKLPENGDGKSSEKHACDSEDVKSTQILETSTADKVEEVVNEANKPRYTESGPVTDEGEIKIRPSERKMVDLTGKLYLAPLTTVGNLPFRRVVKEYGVDVTCGEMAIAHKLLQGSQPEWALLKRHSSEDIFGAQLCGSYPDTMTRCTQLLSETTELDFIDVNLGCPIDLIFKRGEGSALMARPAKLSQMLTGMCAVANVPITCKIRTGIYEDKYIAHTLVPKLRDLGVCMTTIHGRSREQRYTRSADWEYINKVTEAAKPMPIFGNGDIMSFEDANLHRDTTGISGLMIARGALIKPWIFTEIKEQRHWDISSAERFDMLKRFCNYGLEHWGSDTAGVAKTRRFLLEWLSFLHRYIPVGLLERLPQRINEKPPHYLGRDDMETMMGSGNCGDWIKLTEMLLGPVPDGFSFLPKHRAAAYN